MENRDTGDEDSQVLRGEPNQDGGQQGSESERTGQEGDKESVRPSPSGVPNEARGNEVQPGPLQAGSDGRRHYTFKGGQQDHAASPSTVAEDKTRNPA